MEQNIKETHILGMQEEKVRTFGGKTEFVLTTIDTTSPETIVKTTEQREVDKRERHFHQRMLRAYLKGKEFFNFGFVTTLLGRKPQQHKVLVKYI